MTSVAQHAVPQSHRDDASAPEVRPETLRPIQARIATAIIGILIPVLPLFLGGRTPFSPAYLADALFITGMAAVLLVVFPPARTSPASKETKLWVAFAAVVSSYIILQALPVAALADLLGPYPDAIWRSSDVHPSTWSPNPSVTFHGVAVFLALWTAAYTVRHLPSRYLGCIILAVAGSALFQAAYGLLAHASGAQTTLGLWPRVNPDQLSGTFTNRNLYAGYLALTAPLSIRMWWMRHVPLVRDFPIPLKMGGSVFSGALIGMALLSSASRLGAAAGALGILCTTWLWLRAHRGVSGVARWSLHAAIAAGLMTALWYGLAALLSRYVYQGLDSNRWDVWGLMLTELPWRYWVSGVGLGGFEAVFKTVQGTRFLAWYDHAHGDLFQWVLETGLVGAFALTLVVWALSRRMCNDTLRSPLYGGLAAIVLVAFGDFSWHMTGTQLVTATAIGILLRPTSGYPVRGGALGRPDRPSNTAASHTCTRQTIYS